MPELITLDGIPVTLCRRRGCRRMILRCQAGTREFTLSVPYRCSRNTAEAFLLEQLDWIRSMAGEETVWTPEYKAGEQHLLWGDYVVPGQNGMPAGKAFERFRLRSLQEYVEAILPLWERRMLVHVSGIRYREMKSRWGSCNHRNGQITLNKLLARTPKPCVTYVLVHELTHLHHPDHSPAFYQELARWVPDWKTWKKYLATTDLRPKQGEL